MYLDIQVASTEYNPKRNRTRKTSYAAIKKGNGTGKKMVQKHTYSNQKKGIDMQKNVCREFVLPSISFHLTKRSFNYLISRIYILNLTFLHIRKSLTRVNLSRDEALTQFVSKFGFGHTKIAIPRTYH